MSKPEWYWKTELWGTTSGKSNNGYEAHISQMGVDCFGVTVVHGGSAVEHRYLRSVSECMDTARRISEGSGSTTTTVTQSTTAASLVTEQRAPVANEHPAVWDLVIEAMKARDAEGRRKYGVPLQPNNGRDVLVDAFQEALDLVVYLRQAIYERDGR